MKVTVMPAGHGDCILVQCDGFNILVDSGPHEAAIHRRVQAGLSSALKGQPVHLAILTHHDDDHIGGLERTLKESSLQVDALLFNSPLLIRKYIDSHRDEEVNASARQALYVARTLTPSNTRALIAGEQHCFFNDRVKLDILSPHGSDIVKLGASMLAAIGNEELAGSRGRDTPICDQVEELLTMQDDEKETDNSETNGLSLAFALTFEKRSLLFLGDSWPSRVTKSLKLLPRAGTRVPFHYVFVSHHGSKRNSTVELYQQLEATQYVISADGKQNPDVETFGRILRAVAPKVPDFHFSENTQHLQTMFSKTNIRKHFPKTAPLTFDVRSDLPDA